MNAIKKNAKPINNVILFNQIGPSDFVIFSGL